MTWLIDFFKSLWGTIELVISLVISLVEGLIQFLKSIPMFISIVFGVLNRVPSFLLVFVSLTLLISVILILIGRENKN